MSRKRMAAVLVFAGILAGNSLAYGPKGHGIVGAIADQRLAGTPAGAKISALLHGMSLERAALLPDQIKAVDAHPDSYHLPGYPEIETQLVAFLKANPHGHGNTGIPDHHNFHYTDVPVGGDSKYESGTVGRSATDLINIIPYCVKVLKDQIPETNDRKITKTVAVILLAHYLGDIHQPLHVGAQYFDEQGAALNPDTAAGTQAYGDTGGNALKLVLVDANPGHQPPDFHGYWDDQSVTGALALYRKEQTDAGLGQAQIDIVKRLSTTEPAAWKMPAGVNVEDWSHSMANEILPTAKEAHSRVAYSNIVLDHNQKLVKSGTATETPPAAGGQNYSAFAAKTAHDELHKAGWRLADLLTKCVE
jgi:hypothetical protein